MFHSGTASSVAYLQAVVILPANLYINHQHSCGQKDHLLTGWDGSQVAGGVPGGKQQR